MNKNEQLGSQDSSVERSVEADDDVQHTCVYPARSATSMQIHGAVAVSIEDTYCSCSIVQYAVALVVRTSIISCSDGWRVCWRLVIDVAVTVEIYRFQVGSCIYGNL